MQKTKLAGIPVGKGFPVRIMGVINVSPESFFKASVAVSHREVAESARKLEAQGADFIDVGAMSTAPYLKTRISEEEEAFRLSGAVKAIKRMCRTPVSIDTSRYLPAKAGLEAGADILNDVTGLRGDKKMGLLLKKFRGLILMAHASGLRHPSATPLSSVRQLLKTSIRIATKQGMPLSQIVADPGIGFFRDQKTLWWKWDLAVLRDLGQLSKLGVPLLAGVSRKSFIGEILDIKKPEDRLAGSLAATAVAVMNGAAVIRTHDVKETREAVKLTGLVTTF